MNEQEQLERDLQEFRSLWWRLSQRGKEKVSCVLRGEST